MGPVKSRAFCDDGIMHCSRPDPNTLVDLMQEAIKVTLEFRYQENLKFNPSKTKAMFFHQKKTSLKSQKSSKCP